MNRPRKPKYSDHIKTLLYSCQPENVQLAITLGKAVNLQFYKMLLHDGWFKFKVAHPKDFIRLNKKNEFQWMRLEDADMKVLTQLLGLENNTCLYLHNNQLTRTDFLARWSNLEILRIDANKITNLEGLRHLPKLKKLYLDNNQLTDLSPLAGHPCLEELYLRNNPQLQDLSPLVTIPTLKHLDICQISEQADVQDLLKMPRLRYIDRYPQRSISLPISNNKNTKHQKINFWERIEEWLQYLKDKFL
jgi:hypothetical protein